MFVRIMPSWDGGDVPLDPDGFVHLSWAAQVEDTVARHYPAAPSLVFLVVRETALPPGALRIESTDHGSYPHLYAPLPAAAVLRSIPWRQGGPMPRWDVPTTG